MKRILNTLLSFVVCVALVVAGAMFGPGLYDRLFGNSNATWVSERFSETLTEKRELIVLENKIGGQETVSTDAWLIGTVQEVVIPYTFVADFSVNLLKSSVQYDAENNVIQVLLPAPSVEYYKLIVDEDNVAKRDLLYPLTSDRYTQIKQEIEQKLYDEMLNNEELNESAWASAVNETEALYQALLDANGTTAAFAIEVIEAEPQADGEAAEDEAMTVGGE